MLAERMSLRTAGKPDSQDVCFITSTGGRETFLGSRIPFRSGTMVDTSGNRIGDVAAVEMVTVGQRRGLGLPGGGPKRYVVDVDVPNATVIVGTDADLFGATLNATRLTWINEPVAGHVLVQCSAHGEPRGAQLEVTGGEALLTWVEPQRRVAPGQSVVFYDLGNRRVLGGGIAA